LTSAVAHHHKEIKFALTPALNALFALVNSRSHAAPLSEPVYVRTSEDCDVPKHRKVNMATRRIVLSEKTVLEKDDSSDFSPSAGEKSNITPAVPL
jgi:hypothetical protein